MQESRSETSAWPTSSFVVGKALCRAGRIVTKLTRSFGGADDRRSTLVLAHRKSACDTVSMPSVTIRNLPDEVHRALVARAQRHGRSLEAELRAILEDVARSPARLRLGSFLARLGQDLALSEEEWSAFAQSREGSLARSSAIE